MIAVATGAPRRLPQEAPGVWADLGWRGQARGWRGVQRPRALLPLLVFAAAAQGASYRLERAIAPDYYLFVQQTPTEETQFLRRHWEPVFEALREAHLEEDVKDLISSGMDAETAAVFRQRFDEIFARISRIEWSRIGSQEFVYAQRMKFPWPDHLMLFRSDEQTAARNAAILRDLAEYIASLNEGVVLGEQPAGAGGQVWSISIAGTPYRFEAGHMGDVLALALGSGVVGEAFGLMSAEPSAKPQALVDTARFQRAFEGLPAAENGRTYQDVTLLLDDITRSLEALDRQFEGRRRDEGGGQTRPASAHAILRALRRGLDQFRYADYVAGVEWTEGYSVYTTVAEQAVPNAGDYPLFRVLTANPPIEQFDRFVPAEAESFYVCSGIDLAGLYQVIIEFVRDELPDGPDLLERWNGLLETWGIDPQEDVLSWLQGGFATLTLPRRTTSLMGSGSDYVLLLRVRDEQKAASKMDALVRFITEKLSQAGQPALLAPAEGLAGFQSVQIPLLQVMGGITPTWGAAEGHLIVATSPAAVATVLATANGEHPRIRTNRQFVQEGIMPEGAVVTAYFEDLRQWNAGLMQCVAMASVVGATLPFGPYAHPGTATAPATQPQRQPMRILFGMIGALAPVIAQMDFYRSTSSVTTFDGQRWITRSVTTYQPPRAERPTTAPAAPAVEAPSESPASSRDRPDQTEPR